jgi:hypothetical protein
MVGALAVVGGFVDVVDAGGVSLGNASGMGVTVLVGSVGGVVGDGGGAVETLHANSKAHPHASQCMILFFKTIPCQPSLNQTAPRVILYAINICQPLTCSNRKQP